VTWFLNICVCGATNYQKIFNFFSDLTLPRFAEASASFFNRPRYLFPLSLSVHQFFAANLLSHVIYPLLKVE